MRQSEVLSLMRENVAYKLQHGKAKEAVDMLEKLHKYVKFPVLYTDQGCSACISYGLSLFSQCYRAAFSLLLFRVINNACLLFAFFQGRSTRCENISSAYQGVFSFKSKESRAVSFSNIILLNLTFIIPHRRFSAGNTLGP